VSIITDVLTGDRIQPAPFLLLQIAQPAFVVSYFRAYYYRFPNKRSYSASPVPIITDFLTNERSQLAPYLLLQMS
jgi:hypothetical protein